MDSSLVVDAIQRLNDQTKVKNPNYATSLSGHSVIIKKISSRPCRRRSWPSRSSGRPSSTSPSTSTTCASTTWCSPRASPGGDNMDVLLVAVKSDKINDYISVISQTGQDAGARRRRRLRPAERYEVNYDLDPRKVVALVNIGASVTNINILARGTTVFWRDISFGGNQFTEALQREFNLSFEQAEALKRGEPVDRYTAGRRAAGARRGVGARWRRRSRRPSTSSPPPRRRGRSTSWCSPAAAR